ncbi:hypothetical protein PAXRUDRAFT_22721 [Paxillus rubicundulus Ve08.2h10]|uniref:Uncharacterized protein n=1 Tax=Paxillus rubicundulus Ve08.2h10 TaxID=930991 RepID=A0A0D0C8B6_9AGAM|nr:hypothetical protein PAXRUDRAFT_22721 [Paxillus rubicundulus Ve08.2h10]
MTREVRPMKKSLEMSAQSLVLGPNILTWASKPEAGDWMMKEVRRKKPMAKGGPGQKLSATPRIPGHIRPEIRSEKRSPMAKMAEKPIVKPRPGRSRKNRQIGPKIDRLVKAKDRWLGQSQDLAWNPEAKAKMLKGYPGKVGKGRTMARTSNREDPNEPKERQPDSLKKALRLPW